MPSYEPLTVLCLASYEKGHAFLRQAKAEGARVVLLTSLSLQHKAHWPLEAIDEIFYMPDRDKQWDRTDTLYAVAHLCRARAIDRIVPLDDFDLEMAAALREHLRVPGMGETTTRYFRDKLAGRMKAQEAGIAVPDFVGVLNHGRVAEFMGRVSPPWVLKPRMLAGSLGIKKVHGAEELWALLEPLGDQQSFFLLERFVPGDIFHVDSIVDGSEVLFAVASGYGLPPMQVSQQGEVFTSRLLERDSSMARALVEANRRILVTLGLVRGVSHTEFIVAHDDGRVYFLETAARVGGAHVADMVEAATGVNLWAEWARVEIAGGRTPYRPPEARADYAGLLVSLAREEHPDTSGYRDPEIVWRLDKPHHVGFIVRSASHARVESVLADLAQRVKGDFWAYAPPKERPSD